jgi:hypothetical protein
LPLGWDAAGLLTDLVAAPAAEEAVAALATAPVVGELRRRSGGSGYHQTVESRFSISSSGYHQTVESRFSISSIGFV